MTPKAFDTHLVNGRLGFTAHQGLSRRKVYIPVGHAKVGMTQDLLQSEDVTASVGKEICSESMSA